MHYYGDVDFSDEMFSKVDQAAEYIGINLVKWGRIGVRQYKEKYGSVRVYCGFGYDAFYFIWRPNYMWVPKWWPYGLDIKISNYLMVPINWVVVPIQKKIYRYFYKKAIDKWPEIKKEILCCADYPELLRGL